MINNEQGDSKFDGASCEEDAQKLGNRPFIGKVAYDVGLKRVEGMRRSFLGQFGDVRKDVSHDERSLYNYTLHRSRTTERRNNQGNNNDGDMVHTQVQKKLDASGSRVDGQFRFHCAGSN